MKQRSIIRSIALLLTIATFQSSWGIEFIEDYENIPVEHESTKKDSIFDQLVPVERDDEAFKVPEYEELDWKKSGERIKKGKLIFDSSFSLYYQIILPQDFALANDIISLDLTHSTDFLPHSIDLTTYLDQQPNIISQHFYRKIDGVQQYGIIVYRLFTEETRQERYIHMLMGKNLLSKEDLKLFNDIHQSLTRAFLAKRGELSFRSEPYRLTGDLPALTPKGLRDKMTEWLVSRSPFQVIPSFSLYEGGGDLAPMFWRVRWGDKPSNDLIVTAPINDLSREEDSDLDLAGKGNLTFSEVWKSLKKEVKELNDIPMILFPFGQSETIMGKKTGAHWTLLQFNNHHNSWNGVKHDPKSAWNGWIYTQTSLENRLQKDVGNMESFSYKFLSHQDLMNATNCGYFILSYIQFLAHGMKLDEVGLPEIINQFPMWLSMKS